MATDTEATHSFSAANPSNATARSTAMQGKVTIVVVPRERFGSAVRSLRSIVELTPAGYELIYVDCASPQHIALQLKQICEDNRFSYIRIDPIISPNMARNIGIRKASSVFIVFIDNDVIVSKGWLDALVTCAEETHADVVAPLTCQKEPLHAEVHQAGGEFADDHRAFFAARPEDRRITDVHVHQGEKVGGVKLVRGETQCCEFHCALVRADVFERIGQLDERLLATKEHIDFCMSVWSSGGTVMFEPQSIVTYLFPGRNNPLTRDDWRFFALRWSPAWQKQSLEYFQTKWALHADPYFEKRRSLLTWRLTEGIGKPLLSKLPLMKRSHRLRTFALKIVTAALVGWSDRLARTHQPDLTLRNIDRSRASHAQ